MKFRISSCKRTALKKDMGRFAPAWMAYALLLGLILSAMSHDDMDFWFPADIANLAQGTSLLSCGYALITAQLFFGDLFNSRMCNGLHALPLKREHWFSVHVKAGLWYSLIPTALVAAAASLWIYTGSTFVNGWQIPWYWFAVSNLLYVFFFALAVFSAMWAGNRLAMAAVYGLLNFGSLLVYSIVDILYAPLLHGVLTSQSVFTWFCPAAQATAQDYLSTSRVETGRTYLDESNVLQVEKVGVFQVNPEPWIYVGILVILGILLLILARQMYKKRHLECAGDFAAFPALAPVFQVLLTLSIAALFAVSYRLFFGGTQSVWIYVAVGIAAGWFASRMLLTRSTRVFGLKSWLGLFLLAAVFCLSLFVTRLDPLDIEGRIPQVSEVESAQLKLANYSDEYETSDPEEIADLLTIHREALKDHITEREAYYQENRRDYVTIRLEYALKNGLTLRREYFLKVADPEGALAEQYFSKVSAITRNHSSMFNAITPEQLLAMAAKPNHIELAYASIAEEYLTEEFVEELFAAVIADCEEGTMAQHERFHEGGVVTDPENPDNYLACYNVHMYLETNEWIYFDVYPDSRHTLEVLEKTGVLDLVEEVFLSRRAYG